MLWSAIRSAPRPGVSPFSGTVTDTILPLPSSVISTLNGAKPVTSYTAASALSDSVASTAGSAVVSAVTSPGASTAIPFATAACFSASLIASLVSVTPLFTST